MEQTENLPEVVNLDLINHDHHEPDIDRAHKDIPIENIIHYRNKGLKNVEIAHLLDCDPSNISRRLTEVDALISRGKHYRDNKADISSIRQAKYNSSIMRRSEKELDQHSVVQLETAMAIAHDKEDKERDKHETGNDINDMALSLEEIERKLLALEGGAERDGLDP